MKWLALIGLIGFSPVTLAAGMTYTASFSCGNSATLVKVGMTAQDVMSSCGEERQPSFITKSSRPSLDVHPTTGEAIYDNFEKWMYPMAEGGHMHVLIKNEKVIRMFTTK